MEAPETFITIKRWWLLKFRDEDHEETKDDKRSWFVPLAAIGLLVIVAGIVVETYAEVRVSDIDALLRAHESDKITAAEAKSAAAIQEAGNAKKSATDAAGAAGKANLSADLLSKKAGELDQQVKAAQDRLVWQGRRDIPIGKNSKDFKKYLARFEGQKILITVCGAQYISLGDQELSFPALVIGTYLSRIHWDVDGGSTTDLSCGTIGMGVTVEERSDAPEEVKNAGRALQVVLNKALSQGGYGISVAQPVSFLVRGQSGNRLLDADTLKIEVRMHPPMQSPLTLEEKKFLQDNR